MVPNTILAPGTVIGPGSIVMPGVYSEPNLQLQGNPARPCVRGADNGEWLPKGRRSSSVPVRLVATDAEPYDVSLLVAEDEQAGYVPVSGAEEDAAAWMEEGMTTGYSGDESKTDSETETDSRRTGSALASDLKQPLLGYDAL